MLRRRDAADKVPIILDVQVSRRILFSSFQLLSEKAGVKLPGALRIGSTQVCPAKRARLSLNAHSGISLGLPEAESGPRRVLQNRHPSILADIHNGQDHFAAQLPGFGS
jgi:hypothetical protein